MFSVTNATETSKDFRVRIDRRLQPALRLLLEVRSDVRWPAWIKSKIVFNATVCRFHRNVLSTFVHVTRDKKLWNRF